MRRLQQGRQAGSRLERGGRGRRARHPGPEVGAVVPQPRAQVQHAAVPEQADQLRGQALVQVVVGAHLAHLRAQAEAACARGRRVGPARRVTQRAWRASHVAARTAWPQGLPAAATGERLAACRSVPGEPGGTYRHRAVPARGQVTHTTLSLNKVLTSIRFS